MRRMINKKAETHTIIILWVGIFIVAFISIYWLINNLNSNSIDFDKVSYDVETIQSLLNSACSSEIFEVSFNPHINKGNFSFENSTICYNGDFKFCREVFCNQFNLNVSFDLKNLTEIIIEKNVKEDILNLSFK